MDEYILDFSEHQSIHTVVSCTAFEVAVSYCLANSSSLQFFVIHRSADVVTVPHRRYLYCRFQRRCSALLWIVQ